MTAPLSRSDIEHLRTQHTGVGIAPRRCPACAPLTLHPCAIHQLADAALDSPTYALEEATS